MTKTSRACAKSGDKANTVVTHTHPVNSMNMTVGAMIGNDFFSFDRRMPRNDARAITCTKGKSKEKPQLRRWGAMSDIHVHSRVPIYGRITTMGSSPKMMSVM